MGRRNKHSIIVFICLVNVVIHLLPVFHFEFHRDELLYFSLSNHLNFGYATVPPLISYMAFISKSIFGFSVFSVRFFPALFSGLLVFLTAMIARELKGNFRSQLISSICVTGSLFLGMIYGVFTPYFLDIFFWTWIIYLIIRYVNTKKDKYFIILGIAVGLSFLNKYSIVFLLSGYLVVIPFTEYRSIFRKTYFYLGILAAFIIASPNVIWQAFNHLPVMTHMKELNESQLVNVNRIEFIIELLIYLLPATFFILPGIFFFALNKQYHDYRFLLSVVVVVITLIMILRGKSMYTSGLFPFLIVMGALFIEKVAVNRYFYYATVFVAVIMSLSVIPLGLPVFAPGKMITYFDKFAEATGFDLLSKDEDGNYGKLPQLNADMLGWDEMAQITNEAWQKVENKQNAVIFCANYGQGGTVSNIGKKYGLPEPVSFSESFRYWLPVEFKNPVTELVYVIGNDAQESGNFKDTKELFREMIEIGSVSNPLAIEYNTKIYLFRKPRHDFNEFWKKQIKLNDI